MTLMPVATLRIWEQRYRAVRPATAPSGHRLYRAEDVQRVLLLRQLTHQGHAIGSIAALDTARLRALLDRPPAANARTGAGHSASADTDASTDLDAGLDAAPERVEAERPVDRQAVMRLVVIGAALGARLQRTEVARRLRRPLTVLALFETLDAALRGAPSNAFDAGAGAGVDMIVCHAPNLRGIAPDALDATRRAWGARQAAVLYRFAGAAARKSVADAGAMVFREPQDDESLGVWLSFLQSAAQADAPTSGARATPAPASAPQPLTPRPRRFDDATLTAIAGLASATACECPRHVAEVLMQIAGFEAYSADCIDRHPADAELHAHLRQVAEQSRCLFEAALEKVASHEGWTLR